MVRYKKSVLEKQSFSEDRGSPIYKKASTNCVKIFRTKYSSMEIAKNISSTAHNISIKIQRIWRNRSNLSPRHESVYGLRNTSRNLWTQFTVPSTYSSYSSTMQRRSHLWIFQKFAIFSWPSSFKMERGNVEKMFCGQNNQNQKGRRDGPSSFL